MTQADIHAPSVSSTSIKPNLDNNRESRGNIYNRSVIFSS